MPGVQKTAELGRILALPRRRLDLDRGLIEGVPIHDLNYVYLKNAGKCGEAHCPVCIGGNVGLWPTQSAAILEAEKAWGLLGAMGVGSGKSLVSLLLADALGSKKCVLLVPPQLKNQLLTRDMADYGRHFKLSLALAVITVMSYNDLSVADGAFSLDEIKPDLIVADEVHHLAHTSSARTKRFIRYMQNNPSTRFCGLSGTVTRRSIRDYSHLSEIALRAGSPVPHRWSDLQEWAEALDPSDDPLPLGALRVFGETVEKAREGFRTRLVETPGVVATSESWEGASLVITALRPEVPLSVKVVLQQLHATWAIGEEEIESAMRLAEVAKQVSCGFYYKWAWPNGKKDQEWLDARALWHKTVRLMLQRSRPGADSPMLVAKAVEAGNGTKEQREAWLGWKAVSGRPVPPVEVVWIDDFVVKAATAWADEDAIIWYQHTAIGNALKALGFPTYGPGTDAGTAVAKCIVCSITAQGTGKNLQRYNKSLLVEPPAAGATWEQLLGRTHRPGQQADEVYYDMFVHTDELEAAPYRAVEDAQYVQQTQGQRQKLLAAKRVGW